MWPPIIWNWNSIVGSVYYIKKLKEGNLSSCMSAWVKRKWWKNWTRELSEMFFFFFLCWVRFDLEYCHFSVLSSHGNELLALIFTVVISKSFLKMFQCLISSPWWELFFKREVIHIYMGKICKFSPVTENYSFLVLHSIYGILLVIVLMGFRPRKRVNGWSIEF